MNTLIKNKLSEIKNSEDFECWYLVKQESTFWKQCYNSAILEEYNTDDKLQEESNFQKYFERRISEINKEKKDLKLSKEYRSVRVSYYYGLLTDPNKNFKSYSNAETTNIFNEINRRTQGNFEKTDLYSDLIQHQIEKIFISSEIDEMKDKSRSRFRIYPIIYLYKILLEIGNLTGVYSISENEYRYFVSTAGEYRKYLDTLTLINLSRGEQDVFREFSEFKDKIDNRFNLVLEQLTTLKIEGNSISLNLNYLEYVKNIISLFEKVEFEKIDYTTFLGENFSVLDKLMMFNTDPDPKYRSIEEDEKILLNESSNSFIQKIYYGAPGTGKSFNVSEEVLLHQKQIGLISENSATYNSDYVYRTTIHPEYTYHDFVGTIMPIVDSDGSITYEFSPGVFTLALTKALKSENQNIPIYLIIEEISRGNIASVFGDIFQLLDRTSEGISEYKIDNEIISDYLMKQDIKINGAISPGKDSQKSEIMLPKNFNILCTVNTNDQNVFVMDTAFKRRFESEYVSIDPVKKKNSDNYLNDHEFMLGEKKYSWIDFYMVLNDYIVEKLELPEDKQIGQFFIIFDSDEEGNYKKIQNKLLLYLWEDISLIQVSDLTLFKKEYKSYSKLYKDFGEGINVFDDGFLINLPSETISTSNTQIF